MEASVTWLEHVVRTPLRRLPRMVLYGPRTTLCWRAEEAPQRPNESRPGDSEGVASDRNTWRQMCQERTKALEQDRTAHKCTLSLDNYQHLLHLTDVWMSLFYILKTQLYPEEVHLNGYEGYILTQKSQKQTQK